MKVVKLEHACEIINGGTPDTKNPNYWGGHNVWITPAEMGNLNSPYLNCSKRMITDEGLKNSSASLLPPYSVIMSSRAPIGHLVINEILMAFNQGCKGLIPKSNLNYKYLYYFLYANKDYLNSLGSGTTFAEISGSKLKIIEIPLPGMDLQTQIIKKLDKAFAEIDSLEKNLQLKEKKTNQLLQSMLSAAFTNTGKFDMKIIESTLGDLCEVDWGNTNLTKSSYVPDGKFLAISASGPDGRIDHYEHEGNIPVLSAIGAQCGKMFFPTEKFTAIKNTITLTPVKDVVDGKYLYYLFTHIELPQRGAGQPFISKGDIQSFKIAIPKEVKNQRVIVNILDDAFAEIDNLRNQLLIEKERVASLRQSILSNTFRFQEKAA
jgi:type I restriction enzyme S subunit